MNQQETNKVLLLLAAQGDLKKASEIANYLGIADWQKLPADKSLFFRTGIDSTDSADFLHLLGEKVKDMRERLSHLMQADGIYLVFGDGSKLYEPGKVTDEDKARCTGVAVKLGEKSLVVDLHDMEDPEDSGEKDLTLTTAKSPADYDKAAYKDTYEDAGADWDGQANTDRLALAGILNPKIAQQLKKGQYVPAMGQLLFVHLFRKQINQALREVGGEEIGGWWYWTSTECSATYAWLLYLASGNMDTNTKASFRHRVRAVSAFII